MADLKTVDLSHRYSAGTPFEKVALDHINLDIPQGQLVGLLGHTGSGKSTLVQHFNALMKPTEGKVLVDGKDINANRESRRDVRFKVGMVFQYPEYQLFEETVFADIAFGPKNMKLPESEIEERVREAARFAGVEEDQFDESPLELSGGQKRRIAIAGVIAMRPEILILDEPTAGLDPVGRKEILGNLCEYHRETGSTVIIVSHIMDDIARIAERIIVLKNGTVALDGTPGEVFSDPDRVREVGIDIPKSTELALAIEKQGMKLEGPIYTHEQLLAAVKKARGCRNA